MQQSVYRLGLVGYGVLERSDHSAPDEHRLWLEVLPELGEEGLGVNEGQLAEALRHDVPGTLLRALKVLEEDAPTWYDNYYVIVW